MVAQDGLDKTLGFKLANSNTGKGTVQAKTIDQDRLRNKLVGRNFLEKTFVGRFVEDNHVVGLVLYLLGGPLL